MRPVVVGVRAPGRQRAEQQHDQHDQTHDAERDQRVREEHREERRPVGVGPVEADQAGYDRLEDTAGGQPRAHEGALGPQRDSAEREHGDQVGRDEPHQAQQRRRIRKRAEFVAEPDERHEHADAEEQRDRVGALEHVRDRADRVQHGGDAPGGLFAPAQLVGQHEQQQADDDGHDVPGHRQPERVEDALPLVEPVHPGVHDGQDGEQLQ